MGLPGKTPRFGTSFFLVLSWRSLGPLSYFPNHWPNPQPILATETAHSILQTSGTLQTPAKHLANLHLVGGWATPLKNMNVNWDDEIPNSHGKIKFMATKPPTSYNNSPDIFGDLRMIPLKNHHQIPGAFRLGSAVDFRLGRGPR